MKCHYIPQFYLKRWAVDGNLVEFQRRRPGMPEVTPMRRSPAATGWKKDLYTFEGLPEDKKHLIEKAFFAMLDSKAADALSLMENRSGAWTAEVRHAWCLFLMSLITRHPQDNAAFKFVYNRDFLKASADDRERYLAAKGPDDPPTVEEYFQRFHPDVIGNMAMNNIPKLVMHERAVQSLMRMHWSVFTPPQPGYFLTSDRPTIRSFLGQSDSYWIVPIGPRRLFVASERKEYAEAMEDVISRQGWKEVNRIVVRQAVELGYSDDERHLPFFGKHLSKAPRSSGFMRFLPDPLNAPPLDRVP
jgi:hypothetical protein